MAAEKMTSAERRAVISLSSIMGLRMIGLFMVLPVFTLYAQHLNGSTPFLIGLGLGIYGLFQAIFQIPFGTLSDRIGRKPIIFTGLIIFAAGSLIAAFAHSITIMILGRALQGAGAIGSTVLASMADLTRENQRTKAMALSGITIGFSFAIAMILGPLLTKWMPVNNLFLVAVFFAVIAITVLYTSVPTPKTISWHRDTEPELRSFLKLLVDPELAKLNIGILILHAIFTASFIVIPMSLLQFAGMHSSSQWALYLPTLLIAFVLSLVCIGFAERKRQLKPYFLGGISALLLAECLLWFAPEHIYIAAMGLCFFFGGFSLLEAFLPSLISRTAPAARKGSAMGIYSCSQFLGIFIGGTLGGLLLQKYSFAGVYMFCIVLSLFWLTLAFLMQPPRYLSTQIWRISPEDSANWQTIAAKLHVIPGIVEVTFIAEDGLAYLKMERGTMEHPEFIRLKERTIDPIF